VRLLTITIEDFRIVIFDEAVGRHGRAGPRWQQKLPYVEVRHNTSNAASATACCRRRDAATAYIVYVPATIRGRIGL